MRPPSCRARAWVPVMRLAETAGLADLVTDRIRLGCSTGAHPDRTILAIVAGMIAGADCINDLDLLRHGGMAGLCVGVPAPSTLGSFVRSFSWGDARALESVARGVLARLAVTTTLLPGADQIAYLDLGSLLRRTFDTAKQGAGFGHAKVGGYGVRLRDLSPLVAMLCHRARPSATASTSTPRSPVVRTRSAALRAAAEPRAAMPTPTSAARTAAASFAPSLTMATTRPAAASASTTWSFCSGATRAMTSASRSNRMRPARSSATRSSPVTTVVPDGQPRLWRSLERYGVAGEHDWSYPSRA